MTDHATTHWKILTHDRRPPIQGGKALCDGTTWPVVLPEVRVDTSYAECGMGWNSEVGASRPHSDDCPWLLATAALDRARGSVR